MGQYQTNGQNNQFQNPGQYNNYMTDQVYQQQQGNMMGQQFPNQQMGFGQQPNMMGMGQQANMMGMGQQANMMGMGGLMGMGMIGLDPLSLARNQAQFFPILGQNLNNPFVCGNLIFITNTIFFEIMKTSLVEEHKAQEYSNILQTPLVLTSGSIVYPDAIFSRTSMPIKCKACGQQSVSEVETECSAGNACCCLQGLLFPHPGLIMACVYNVCQNEYHNVVHKCKLCKAVQGSFITEAKDACVCYSRYTNINTSSNHHFKVYEGKGVDEFLKAQQWPGRVIQQGRGRRRR